MSSRTEHQEHATPPSGAAQLPETPTVSIACPGCHELVPAGARCPHCGRPTGPLSGLLSDPYGPLPEVAVPEPADATVVLPPARERTAELDLSALRTPDETAPPASLPAGSGPGVGSLRPASRRLLGVLVGGVALLVVGAVAVAGLFSGAAGGGRHASPAANTATADVSTVDPANVQVRASSTQQPDGGVSYAAANTLDGRPTTAWNSDGQGVGAELTYSFTEPIDLRSLTVLNGYQKSLQTSKGTVDLFALNERVRTFTVVTDTGRVTWSLRDDRAPQTLTHDFGRTRTVRLEVTAVYPSAKYHDLAVSEVSFGAAG